MEKQTVVNANGNVVPKADALTLPANLDVPRPSPEHRAALDKGSTVDEIAKAGHLDRKDADKSVDSIMSVRPTFTMDELKAEHLRAIRKNLVLSYRQAFEDRGFIRRAK